MHVTKVTFRRLTKFIENGAALTSAQIAAATYVVVVGGTPSGTRQYPVPASTQGDPVVVTFAELGFVPVPGVQYTLSVIATLDGVESPASAPVKFTNSMTPAAPETVSVS